LLDVLSQVNISTDLALEAHAQARARAAAEIPGVTVQRRQEGPLTITRVLISTPEGGEALGKPPGTYVTVYCPDLRRRSREAWEATARQLAVELTELLGGRPEGDVLVVGLGNWNATPDALGPLCVERVLVTRHLEEHLSPEAAGKLRGVAALAPGVLGLTGIETGDIVQGVVERIRPSAVVVVDALAAREVGHILTTVQLSDTGIHPGAGVGNRRLAIHREKLGIPTVAVGVPTVVSATAIAAGALHDMVNSLRTKIEFYQILAQMSDEEHHQLLTEVLGPELDQLMVTPKEIDTLVEDMAKVLATGINIALQPEVDPQEFMVSLA